jgi:serine/threonine protein kinase
VSSPSLSSCLSHHAGQYDLDDSVWAEVHDSAKDMLSHMMVVDPAQRWTARKLLQHKWFEVCTACWRCSRRHTQASHTHPS